ncbi:MAG: Uracil-DNA glycosylase superfamily [Ilumatobacteraceae bacterium]|nr:Uracil-DNA glycosylase superfamily [Ilumatobacteraceae bacterium]
MGRPDLVVDGRKVRPTDLPVDLAQIHRRLGVGGQLRLTASVGPHGDWDRGHLTAVVEAAGFAIDRVRPLPAPPGGSGAAGSPAVEVAATALRALPDHVGASMRLLCCGLNPSLHAADAGVGYVTGSNRFWRALAAAGLSTSDRDPVQLLRRDRIGMTDLVKRPTARADELEAAEYRAGLERLDQLCAWLRPEAVAVVGLAGWRSAVHRKATVGWQERTLGPSAVYVLPSTSGLNAGTSLDDLVGHLLAAAAGPGHT